jgi:hypothetical protein
MKTLKFKEGDEVESTHDETGLKGKITEAVEGLKCPYRVDWPGGSHTWQKDEDLKLIETKKKATSKFSKILSRIVIHTTVIYFMWNLTLPEIANLNEITFMQSIALYFLARALNPPRLK